jgi:hypothetical protein
MNVIFANKIRVGNKLVEQNHGNRQRTDEQLNEHQSPETK